MKEQKTQSVALSDLDAMILKLSKDGWQVTGYDFAPEGPSHTGLILEREKKAAKAPAKPVKKDK